MSSAAKVPDDHPLMIAWQKYLTTEEYANSERWARQEQHTKGSMWAAFVQGWEAAQQMGAQDNERE